MVRRPDCEIALLVFSLELFEARRSLLSLGRSQEVVSLLDIILCGLGCSPVCYSYSQMSLQEVLAKVCSHGYV